MHTNIHIYALFTHIDLLSLFLSHLHTKSEYLNEYKFSLHS